MKPQVVPPSILPILSDRRFENFLLFVDSWRSFVYHGTKARNTSKILVSKWFTSFFGGTGNRTAGNTLASPGVREHLYGVIGVGAETMQHRAQCMADLRLPACLLLQNRAGRLVQQLITLHDPVNFVGRRWFPGHLDVLAG